MEQNGKDKKFLAGDNWELLAAAMIFAFYARGILSFFPNRNGLLGLDWQYYLPSLLGGYFGALGEGYLSLQWFTPAFCGGVPKFANPVDVYLSVPQWLFFIAGPLGAIRISTMLFAAIGFAGAWMLLRSVFQCGKPAALAGATAFLFNGFYAGGMIMGHLNKHPFMLLPLIAWLLARAGRTGPRPALERALPLAGAAALLAYTIYAGGFIIFPGMLLALIGIGFLARLRNAPFPLGPYLAAGGAAVAASLALAASKIAAVSALLHQFPRDFYPLPLVEGVGGLARLFLLSLFGDAAALKMEGLFHSYTWEYQLEEFDFGITWIPLALMAAGLCAWLWKRPCPALRGRWLAAAGLAAVLLMPMALNYYSPAWAALLKALPLIKNSSSNLRWLAIYVPLFSIIAAIGFEAAFGNSGVRAAAAGIACAALVALTANFPARQYYQDMPYDPAAIDRAYQRATARGAPPAVETVDSYIWEGKLVPMLGGNDLLAYGKSSMLCYEPIFGYRLEAFPFKTLRPGPVMAAQDGALNLKNPACFIFPAENGCAPGDHFRTDDAERAARFASYQGIDFARSRAQKAADAITVVAWIALLTLPMALWLRRRGGK